MRTAHRHHHHRRYHWSPTGATFSIFFLKSEIVGVDIETLKALTEGEWRIFWEPKHLSMMDPSYAQNPYISLAVTWIRARPPMVFPKLLNSGSIGVCHRVGLTRCSKTSCPLGGTFRAKLSVMFKGWLLYSTVHTDEHVADFNHPNVQRGG